MGHDIFENELIIKEIYDTDSLPKNKGIIKNEKFSVILGIS